MTNLENAYRNFFANLENAYRNFFANLEITYRKILQILKSDTGIFYEKNKTKI